MIGKLPAEQVSLHEWLILLEKHATARPGIAERILINAKQMLKWAVRRKLIATSALAGEEIARLWRAIERSRMVAVEGSRLLLDDYGDDESSIGTVDAYLEARKENVAMCVQRLVGAGADPRAALPRPPPPGLHGRDAAPNRPGSRGATGLRSKSLGNARL